MPIATINLSALTFGTSSQTGSFTTDAAADVTTTTTAAVAINATVVPVASSANFADAPLFDLPGAGPSGALKALPVLGVDFQGANQIVIPSPGIETAVASGATLTRYNRLPIAAQPRHVRVTWGSGNYLDWVAGMEPFSANSSIGGTVALLTKAMLCQPGAIHFAPGILVGGVIYDIVIDY